MRVVTAGFSVLRPFSRGWIFLCLVALFPHVWFRWRNSAQRAQADHQIFSSGIAPGQSLGGGRVAGSGLAEAHLEIQRRRGHSRTLAHTGRSPAPAHVPDDAPRQPRRKISKFPALRRSVKLLARAARVSNTLSGEATVRGPFAAALVPPAGREARRHPCWQAFLRRRGLKRSLPPEAREAGA